MYTQGHMERSISGLGREQKPMAPESKKAQTGPPASPPGPVTTSVTGQAAALLNNLIIRHMGRSREPQEEGIEGRHLLKNPGSLASLWRLPSCTCFPQIQPLGEPVLGSWEGLGLNLSFNFLEANTSWGDH